MPRKLSRENLRKVIHPDLISITLSSLIAGVGKGMIGVFIPLLLLNQGLELWHVCAFYAAYALCKLIINYPSARLINKYGARLGLIVGYSATALFLGTLSLFIAWGGWYFIALMAIFMSAKNSFMWNSQHLHISRVMNVTRKSRDLAMIANISRIVGIFTPLLGGIIAVWFGEVWLAVIASVIVFAAIFPIWHMDKLAGGHQPDKDLRYSLRRAPWRDVIANFSFNIHTAVGVMVWPIYLAIFIPNFGSIGIIITISTLIAVVVLHFAAKRGDTGKSYRVLVEGTAASSIVHIGRILANSNPFTITLISAFYDIALSYQNNPWTSIYYSHARQRGFSYIMAMEIAGDIAYVVLWGALGAIAYLTSDITFFAFAFFGAAIIAWGCLLMRREMQPAQPQAT